MGSGLAVDVSGLKKRYGARFAVDGLDLAIPFGQCYGLLGPNGAGKTTTVEILEGYRQRDGGEVLVLGVDPQTAGLQWRSRIGIVLQEASDNSMSSVGEVVRHFARLYPNPRDPNDVIESVGLSEKTGERVAKLSGGQRRRLDVALGIVGNPELLFLDEPTTGFDPEARRRFWELVESLKSSGTTIVLTTHYLDEAAHLADRVGVVSRGRIVASGTPEELAGGSTREAVVTWNEEDGEVRSVSTREPSAFIRELLGRFSGEVPGLTVSRPSLEEVYLQIIRDEEMSDADAR